MRKKLGVIAFCMASSAVFAAEVKLPPGVVKPSFFDKNAITVVGYQKGVSGLNIWQVEKGPVKTVFYSTQDNKVLMSGVLWDATTGANLSDVYIPAAVVDAAVVNNNASSNSVPTGTYSHDKTSDAIASVATLVGIKEGHGAVDKTLYIIFDPRCPHCHAVYEHTRDYIKHGGSIKWIPSTVLGDITTGSALIAQILESKDPVAALGTTMGKTAGGMPPSAATMKAVTENNGYFFAAFDRNRSAGSPGVPVAFFEKQNGEPQMVGSIDDDLLLPRILHDVKQ